MSPILSRETIAQQADEAAKDWVAAWTQDPAAPKPANPFNEFTEPDHFMAWRCDFRRSCAERAALPETEGSA